jgi:serine/threonine-protein kinase
MTGTTGIVGRYHVERLIAHGGMGSLYLARDPAIDRQVVIKVLKDGFDDPAARERFAREARAAGRLHHPNIVTVFDVGEHDARPFIAMEYVAGETLAQLIGRRAIIRLWEKLAILEGLCAGLHFAHGAAIVHRDIKPANVMLHDSGVVKILDFGIARGGGAGLTRAGDVVGTLNYMSPEQLVGEPVDHRSDIYSVGVLAYELITDQMAFPGTVQTGVLSKILYTGPVPIASLVPEIDPDITAIIERAMAREADARYPDLETLRQDLAKVRARLFETAPQLDEATDPNAETRFDSARIASGPYVQGSSGASAAPRLPSGRRSDEIVGPRRRTRAMLLLGMGGATLAIGIAAALMLNRSAATNPPVTSATAPPAAQSPSPSAQPAPRPGAAPAEGGKRAAQEQQPNAARASARQQIAAGQRQRVPDNGAPQGTAQNPSAAPSPPAGPTAEPPSTKPPGQPIFAPPSPEMLKNLPAPVDKPGIPAPPATAPRSDPPAAPREPAPDPGAADQSAIRDMLRRYVHAYQSLDEAAVGRLMPSLTPAQLRDLDRDFSNYRRYTVELGDEQIKIDGPTATVTCQVVRSFEMKTGVTGGNTRRTVFHLRRSGAGWIIERLESR